MTHEGRALTCITMRARTNRRTIDTNEAQNKHKISAVATASIGTGVTLIRNIFFFLEVGTSPIQLVQSIESASPSNDLQDAAEGIQRRNLDLDPFSLYKVDMFDFERGRMHASLVNMSVTYHLCGQ